MLLQKGSVGADVKKIQVRLNVAQDGIFGPKTQEAVKAWQLKNGLTPDGVVGNLTWSSLFPPVQTVEVLNTHKLQGAIPDEVISQLDQIATQFGIINNIRLAHFLGQCSNESGNFRVVDENLNYDAVRLVQVFPYYFNNTTAPAYAHQPEKIANKVYGSRMGNGPESSGEGWKYRGRGYIQLTGKDNYKAFSTFIGEDCISNPDAVMTKHPLASAAFYFNSNHLWTICDKGCDDNAILAVTKAVNGGTIGLPNRIVQTKKFWTLLAK